LIGHSINAVFCFEWKRALTLPRLTWWTVLALFPGFIVGLIRFTMESPLESQRWTGFLFALIPMLLTMMGTFLGATPAVSAEVEGKSWTYLAVRPHGTTVVLLGKYLATVTWVFSAAFVGFALAMVIMPYEQPWEFAGCIVRLTLLSCPAYAALYLLLGTLFPKRSMVIAVAYTLIFELLISLVPALINTFTIQFRLRTLLVEWAHIQVNSELLAFVGDPPAWEHVIILLAYTTILLLAAVGTVRLKEFSLTEDGNA